MEEAVKSGLAEAIQEEGAARNSGGPPLTLKVPQVSKPAGEEETAALASSLVAAAFEKAKKSLATSPKKTVLSLSSAGRDLSSPTKQRKLPKKSPGKKTSSKKHFESSQVDGPAEGGLFLQIPLSRMSVAWSTASTRDDESAPASPTELDNIALGMVTTVEEYSGLLADIIIRDVITMYSTPQHLMLARCPPEEEKSGDLSYRVQTFLHSLEEVKSFSSEPDITRIPPFSPHCYNLRKSILRPVASGLRDKASGDPQLEAVVQWLAVSMCGRPEMRYHTFREKKLKQVCVFQCLDQLGGVYTELVSPFSSLR